MSKWLRLLYDKSMEKYGKSRTYVVISCLFCAIGLAVLIWRRLTFGTGIGNCILCAAIGFSLIFYAEAVIMYTEEMFMFGNRWRFSGDVEPSDTQLDLSKIGAFILFIVAYFFILFVRT